ncbi:hypothetical protein [Trujillonella humicola]|uniref:hypothetical protein n=1 Tax=Trujillonella humicola TaxID=3383699 RepID=UPI00390604FE
MSASALQQQPWQAAWQWLRRGARAAALGSYGLLAAAGAVASPAPSLLIGAVLAATGGAIVAWLHHVPNDLPPFPHPAVAGTYLACLPAAIAGTVVFGHWAGVIVGLGLVAGTSFAVHWVSQPPAGDPPLAPGRPASADEDSLREMLRLLPEDALLDEWRTARAADGRSDGATPGATRFRELLIDEILRRDPGRAGAWLEDGSGGSPGGVAGGRPG